MDTTNMGEHFVFLIQNLYSRHPLTWCLVNKYGLTSLEVAQTMERAMDATPTRPVYIVHGDNSPLYSTHEVRSFLETYGILLSSTRNEKNGNQTIESLFNIFKTGFCEQIVEKFHVAQSVPFYKQRLTLEKRLKKSFSTNMKEAYRNKEGRQIIFESDFF